MDLLASTEIREGNRGGRDQFSWEKVKEDKYRENYLGHSIHAPVGLSAKRKDPQWFTKPPARHPVSNREELEKIQQQEAIMLRASLQGIPVQDAIALALQQTTQESNSNENTNANNDQDVEEQEKPREDSLLQEPRYNSKKRNKEDHRRRHLKRHSGREHRHDSLHHRKRDSRRHRRHSSDKRHRHHS
jgi:hypothetical protein